MATWAILDDKNVVTNRIEADTTFIEASGQHGIELREGQPCDIGWVYNAATETFAEPIAQTNSEPEYHYRWTELKGGLRGTDLFGIAFQNPSVLNVITDAMTDLSDTNEHRWEDFSFAVLTIQEQYTTEQKDRFQALLQDTSFPAIAFN